jgi:hypothetical protein
MYSYVQLTVNVFELSAVATPIAGAIAGALSVKSPGSDWRSIS